MGKNKKKKAQMFSNFLAFKAGQGNQNPTNIITVKKSYIPSILQKNKPFQTPHSDQEKLTELLDDNSPNVGGGGTNTGIEKPSTSNVYSAQISNKWKPVEDTSNIQVNMRTDSKRPNLTIVEGSASKIQLVMDKSKKPIVQSGSSPKAEGAISSSLPIPIPQPNQQTNQTNQQTSQLNQQTNQPAYSLIQQSKAAKFQYSAPKKGNQQQCHQSSSTASYQEDKSPPGQRLPQQEQTNPGPSWSLTSHTNAWTNNNPEWHVPILPNQTNTGTGWPKLNSIYGSNYPGTVVPGTPWQVTGQPQTGMGDPLYVQTDLNVDPPPQAYSPSDVYSEAVQNDDAKEEHLESTEMSAGTKRLSAFQRLGPVAEQPKKPKLTINLICQKDVRNVVDETDDVPTHQRDYITTSTDETVVKYLEAWPFKKQFTPVRIATVRVSKSVMMLETEYMEEAYTRDNRFILVTVTGYPQNWKKEDVLDAILDSVNGKSLIPCFIEFSKVECKFLVIRSRLALLAIHKYGFIVRKDDVELIISVANMHLNLNQLDFVPRLIIRKLMSNRLDGASLDLSEFTLKSDISHFIYFPLYRTSNQTELMQLQSNVPWERLTSLDLSRNRITDLSGLELLHCTPRLRNLNLSHNCIENVTDLLHCRNLPLRSIHLEGNPLCNDYIEEEHYIKVLKLLFPGLVEIDGVVVMQMHNLPDPKRNYCPEEALPIVNTLLEIMFPLIDASLEQRFLIEDLYHEDAVLTITFMYKLRYSAVFRDYRNLFNRSRVMDEGDMTSIVGHSAIAKVIHRWPDMMHDPTTFDVDVLYHSDTTTIVRICGIVKITAESLADDEYLLSFTRTLVLHTKDGTQYKITNELLYWDEPEKAYAETAFKITMVTPKNLSMGLDGPPDDSLKEKLLSVFMQITKLQRKPSERCLEAKDWNIKNALEYFTKLLKLDNLNPIMEN